MPAIQKPMLVALKKLLQERFVQYLPPLLGNANTDNKQDKQISRAFSAFALQALFDANPKTASQAVVDDYNDNGIDAIYYNELDKTLYIVQSKLKGAEQFQLAEAQSFLSGVKLIINKDFDSFNANVKKLIPAIEKALDECDQIKLVIAYTGDGISIQAQNEIKRVVQAEIDDGEEQLQLAYVDFGPTNVEQTLRDESAIKLVNDRIKIQKYRLSETPKKTVFGIVNLKDLVKLHEKHGRSFYEKNIRYFIGTGRRGVNSAIKNTLLNEPEHFLYLNNGITVVGNSVKQRSKSRDNKTTREFEVTGMSVVNGAQTISTTAQFLKENPGANIDSAQVMLTLINTGSDSFHKQVTKARNLQNPVDLSNFAALDDNQEKLRQEIALYGVEYHYRPQRQLSKNIPIIEIETLSKALACLEKDITFPVRLKTEPSQFVNYESDVYKGIFKADLSGSKAINAVYVYSVIIELLLIAERSSPSPEKLVYRHCNYAMASILMKSFNSKICGDVILTKEDIKATISGSFDELRQKFADQYLIDGLGSAHHAFFKRLSDTTKLIQNVAIKYQGLTQDQNVIKLQARIDYSDPYNQNLTNCLSGKSVQL
ncbi:AIPR family protein [Thalassotalea atypica]|uniref:AIPR family protein n=1 Tax=Thalassotalea atypica TaxID=2054316 RepID=UPI0025747FC2|nr:AIPR family protein [Thalassotalea atypica]